VLRDYLEVRPENRARLVQYIQTSRIECGPWYVLSDQFLVSGESHIRNLWLGRRVAQGWTSRYSPWAICRTPSATSARCRKSWPASVSTMPLCGGDGAGT
jgi:hypothetical protein